MNQTIGVNITPQSFQPTLHYSQGDVGRTFVINVTDYDIPSGATVTCVATKPSGMGFTVNGTVSGNTVTFTSTAEMTDEWGRFPAEIRIVSGNTLLGTANFLMIGEKDPHPASTIDGTQEELIPQLTLLVNRVEAAAESVHDLTVSATTLAAGSDATATYDSANNSIAFGIPRGADGDVTRSEFNDLKSDIKKSTSTVEPTFTAGYAVLTNVAIGATVNLSPVTSSNHSYAIVNCEEGDKFLLNGTTGASYVYLWSFVDADNKLLSRAASSITAVDLVITAPEDAAKCVLNFTTATMGDCLYGGALPFKIIDIDNEIDEIESDISTLEQYKQLYTNNLLYGGTLEEKTYYKGTDGVKDTNNNFFSVSTSVDSSLWGKSIWSYSDYVPNTSDRNAARSVVFYDNNGDYLSGYEPHNSPGNHDTGFPIPTNAVMMRASFYYVTNATMEKPSVYWITTTRGLDQFDYLNKDVNVYTSTLLDDGMAQELADFVRARRPVIAFTLDGNYARTDDIVEIAENHGYRIGIAPKYMTSFFGTEGTDNFIFTVSQFLEWQKNGHEILSHMNYDMPEINEYTDAQCHEFIKQSYLKMVERGFHIKGAIGSSGKVADRFIPYVQRWYSYASTEPNHSEWGSAGYTNGDLLFATSEPYKLWRYSMQLSTLAGMKQAVDDAIANNGLVIFYGHAQSASEILPRIFEDGDTYGDDPDIAGSTTNLSGTDHFTEENFDALLTYIDGKVADGACEVKTPFNAVNDYYRIRKTDFTW